MLDKIKQLTSQEFENFILDILVTIGLRNAIWRTPGRDGGRDIEGVYFVTDLSGYKQQQKWYIECKKYNTTVGWPTIHEKLSYANVYSADFLLIVTTSSVTPQANDAINQWNISHDRPQIRVWEGYKIVHIVQQMPSICIKYGLSSNTKDIAVSFLSLSKIIQKFVLASYSESVFKNINLFSLQASAAMADLSERRMGQIEESGQWQVDKTRSCDLYCWSKYEDDININGYDRYALRAVLCAYRSMTKSSIVRLSRDVNGYVVVSSDGKRNLSDGHRRDLCSIAFWGNFDINFDGSHSIVLRRRDCES